MSIKFNEQAVTKYVRDLQRAKKGGLTSVEGVPGLNMIVKPSGVASYIIRYYVGHGASARREKKHVIGRHGRITLADAKAEALRIMREHELGSDPIEEARKAKKVERATMTLREMWDRRVAQDDKLAPSSIEKYEAHLKQHVWKTPLGDRPAADITADDIVEVLTAAEAKSKAVAHSVRSALSGLYRYGVQRRWVQKNPVSGLGFNVASKPRKRRVTDVEIAGLWRAFDHPQFGANEGTKIALKLAVLLGQRPSELVSAQVDELELDGPAPKYSPPAARMKRKSTEDVDRHIVPLSTQAVTLFRRAVELSVEAGDGVHVFPGHVTGRQKGVWKTDHLTRNGLSVALRKACKLADVKNLRNHDWRKAVVSWLNERGTRHDVLDRILHHKPRGVTGVFYDFATLEGPMREAMQRWADHVWAVTRQVKVEDSVVTLGAKRA
jgi:integrase